MNPVMKQRYRLEGLTCPNCSAKIEREVAALKGVAEAAVNLPQQILTVRLTEENAENGEPAITAIVHAHEKDVKVYALNAEKPVRQRYRLAGLTCPNCSAEIERELRAFPEVAKAEIDLPQQLLVVEVSAGTHPLNAEAIEKIVRRHEKAVDVLPLDRQNEKNFTAEAERETETEKFPRRLFAAAGLLAVGLIGTHFTDHGTAAAVICLLAYVLVGAEVLLTSGKNILHGEIFDENFLMSVASLGAIAIGEYPEAAAVMLFYEIGEYCEDRAAGKSRDAIAKMMEIAPETATVYRNGSWITVDPEAIEIGEILAVNPGEKIPLDGEIVSGESLLDTRSLTGESVERTAQPGDAVLAGCVNKTERLTIKATALYADSAVAKMLELMETSGENKARTERFITRFAKVYTPTVVGLALLLALLPPLLMGGAWTDWIRRGLVFLVVSCPCALVLSIPLTYFGGMGAASKKGLLIKGGAAMDALAHVGTFVFDKTGTLTRGVFRVQKVEAAPDFDEKTVLNFAALAESGSNHPIAKSIRAEVPDPEGTLDSAKDLSGFGIEAVVSGHTVRIGKRGFLPATAALFSETELTSVYVEVDGQPAGAITIADEIRPGAVRTLRRLRKLGVKRCAMLTGDREAPAAVVGRKLHLDEIHAELLPEDKVAKVAQFIAESPKKSAVAFVGDGMNDAPVIARADVGIAVGGIGSDIAIEAADVVLMTEDLTRIPDGIRLARATNAIVWQNILLALGIKVLIMLFGALGLVGMWAAVFGDVGVLLLAVANALRIMKK